MISKTVGLASQRQGIDFAVNTFVVSERRATLILLFNATSNAPSSGNFTQAYGHGQPVIFYGPGECRQEFLQITAAQ